MRIITNYAKLTRALSEVTPVLSDRLMPEDQKNIVFWVKEGKVKVVCNNLYITCISDLEANVVFEGENESEEHYIQVKAKELTGYLSGLNSLKVTKIDGVELDIRENEIRLLVTEVPINAEDANAHRFNQVSKYRLAKTKVVERIKNELQTAVGHISTDEGFTEVQKADMLLVLNSLLPAVSKELRDSVHTRVTFANGYVYIIPQTYAALMRNCMPEAVSDFIITNSVGVFMQNFFALEDTTMFKKFASAGEAVIIVLKNSNATAVIKSTNANKAFNIEKQKAIPTNGIAVSRAYFTDVMKRIATTNTEITFKVKIAEGEESVCSIANKAMTQAIPVMAGKGSGEYSFTLKPDLLSAITFNSVATSGNYLFFYLETDDNGKITLVVADDVTVNEDGSHLWQTSTRGLALAKGDFQWN